MVCTNGANNRSFLIPLVASEGSNATFCLQALWKQSSSHQLELWHRLAENQQGLYKRISGLDEKTLARPQRRLLCHTFAGMKSKAVKNVFTLSWIHPSDLNNLFFFQVIQWMQNPSDTNSLRDFQEWKEKCDIKGQPYCQLPNACPLTTRELPGEVIRLHTCVECPNNYPWLLDPTGDGFNFKWVDMKSICVCSNFHYLCISFDGLLLLGVIKYFGFTQHVDIQIEHTK